MERFLEGGWLVTPTKSKSESASLPHDRCMRGSAQMQRSTISRREVDYERGKEWTNASSHIHCGSQILGCPKGQLFKHRRKTCPFTKQHLCIFDISK